MFRISHSRTPSLTSTHSDADADSNIGLDTPSPTDRASTLPTPPRRNRTISREDEMERDGTSMQAEMGSTSITETPIAMPMASTETIVEGEKKSPHYRLPRAVCSRSASPPHAPRSGYMWIRVPLNGNQEAKSGSPVSAVREEPPKGVPARPRHVSSKSVGSLPTLTTTGLFPGPGPQRGPTVRKYHRTAGPYTSFVGLRPSAPTGVSPGSAMVAPPAMGSTRPTTYQPIPYRYIGPSIQKHSTDRSEKGKKKLLLVGPAIAQHLKAGGGVRVRDFEGSIVGWIR